MKDNIDDYLKDYMTTVEAAKKFGTTPSAIRQLIKKDELEYIKVDWPEAPHVGFKYMVNIYSLNRYYNTPQIIDTPVTTEALGGDVFKGLIQPIKDLFKCLYTTRI